MRHLSLCAHVCVLEFQAAISSTDIKIPVNDTSGHKVLSVFGRHLCVHSKSLQSCLTVCDPVGYSPPCSSVHGILQVRILELVAMPLSRESSQPRNWIPHLLCLLHWQADCLPQMPPGKHSIKLGVEFTNLRRGREMNFNSN